MTLVALYAIAVAILVAGMWSVSLWTGNVPELTTKPWEIRLHITAELAMAAVLLAAGAMQLAGSPVGPGLLAIGLGMTAYSIVNSSGYYVERRQWPPVVLFAVLFALTLGAIAVVVTQG